MPHSPFSIPLHYIALATLSVAPYTFMFDFDTATIQATGTAAEIRSEAFAMSSAMFTIGFVFAVSLYKTVNGPLQNFVLKRLSKGRDAKNTASISPRKKRMQGWRREQKAGSFLSTLYFSLFFTLQPLFIALFLIVMKIQDFAIANLLFAASISFAIFVYTIVRVYIPMTYTDEQAAPAITA